MLNESLREEKEEEEEECIDIDVALEYLNALQSRAKAEELNELLVKSERMLEEASELRNETETLQGRLNEANRCMSWTERRLEDIRRQQNRSAAIIWNFPDDLHPTMIQSASQIEKTETVKEFFRKTVGMPEDLANLVALQHIRVFYTVFQSERSANVRLQFADDESKELCESYCITFLKTFNQMRQRPTRWREDQTEMQRDQEKEQRQKQKQDKNGAAGRSLLFTKFIQWPPPQRA